MGEFSIWHWMVVLLVVLLLFGGGKVSGLMGDLAGGIKAFKKNLADDPVPPKDTAPEGAAQSISSPADEHVVRPGAAGETAAPEREPALASRETTAAH
jgi:sec-independent protein translocase protein TatA